jgi:hypothetical protein
MLDGDSTVAAFAQETLAGLDAAGLTEPELLTEVSGRILRRPEKKLVRAQLSWLDRAARRAPVRAEPVVLAAAVAFEHPDPAVQELALTTITRHLRAAGASVLPALRTAAEQLNRALSARAGELLGTRPEDAPASPADILPVVDAPRPVPGPIATAAEVAEEVGAVLAGDQSVVAFERALDGLVHHARLDLAGLAGALRPIMRPRPSSTWERDECTPTDLRVVTAAVTADVTGDEPPGWSMQHRRKHNSFSGSSELLAARIDEAAEAVRSGELPFLLATPTLATGVLDAAVLVERIAAYERLDTVPGPYDLAQALLRATPTTDERVLSAADALGSEAGRQVATWLRAGGLPHQRSEPADWEHRGAERHPCRHPAAPALEPPCPLPPHAMRLLAPYRLGDGRPVSDGAFWPAQLPHHRDEFAARAHRDDTVLRRGAARTLPSLAQSDGPAGYALHMIMAEGLRISATERPADHLAAVDAVLILAARGHLDSALLGCQLGLLTRTDWPLTNRLTTTLRVMAETGAYATAYAILRATLPDVLGDEPVRGAGELLQLAVERALRCRATGEITEVTAVADRKGSSQLVKCARALRDTLRQNASQSPGTRDTEPAG